ncbi:hypothetical protein [Vibrio astriarenae]|uniref:hypothetical protein n=1 Tax=Vibrio astriarenae TaxID=1481923 RepID=UPI0037363AF6
MKSTDKLYNIVVKQNEPVVVPIDETLSYFMDGWAVVKLVEASDPETALQVYTNSFSKNDEDDYLFSTFSTVTMPIAEMDEPRQPETESDEQGVSAQGTIEGAVKPNRQFSADDDSMLSVNPASGLPMIGTVDSGGNLFGHN